MKRLLNFAFVLLLGMTPAVFAESVKPLTPEELQNLEKKGKIYFLDVRESREIEALGTMKGYVNIPLSQLEKRLAEVPKSALIVTAWNRGTRAARAADILQRHGYKVIGSCALEDWKQKGVKMVYPKTGGKK